MCPWSPDGRHHRTGRLTSRLLRNPVSKRLPSRATLYRRIRWWLARFHRSCSDTLPSPGVSRVQEPELSLVAPGTLARCHLGCRGTPAHGIHRLGGSAFAWLMLQQLWQLRNIARLASSRAIRCAAARRPGLVLEKSKAGIGRPLHRHRAGLWVAFDGNIQDPISRRPTGKRTKVRHGFCLHRYAFFHLDLRFPKATSDTSSHVVNGLGRVSHRRFRDTWLRLKNRGRAITMVALRCSPPYARGCSQIKHSGRSGDIRHCFQVPDDDSLVGHGPRVAQRPDGQGAHRAVWVS